MEGDRQQQQELQPGLVGEGQVQGEKHDDRERRNALPHPGPHAHVHVPAAVGVVFAPAQRLPVLDSVFVRLHGPSFFPGGWRRYLR